jgi:hypothetical protein
MVSPDFNELIALLREDGIQQVRFVRGRPQEGADLTAMLARSLSERRGALFEAPVVNTVMRQLAREGLLIVAEEGGLPCAICLPEQAPEMRALLFAPIPKVVMDSWTWLWEASEYETTDTGIVHGYISALRGMDVDEARLRRRMRLLFARGHCFNVNRRVCIVTKPPGVPAKEPLPAPGAATTARQASEQNVEEANKLIIRAWRLLWSECHGDFFDGALIQFLMRNLQINRTIARKVTAKLEAVGALEPVGRGQAHYCRVKSPPDSDCDIMVLLE